MNRLVVDASVALKWFFRTRADEPDVQIALQILQGVHDGRVGLLQPPHFLAEMAAVLIREAPTTAAANWRDLQLITMQVVEGPAIYTRAMALAKLHQHHLFDTLYHAVALEAGDAMLVTADAHYARKAHAVGSIVRLSAFKLGSQ